MALIRLNLWSTIKICAVYGFWWQKLVAISYHPSIIQTSQQTSRHSSHHHHHHKVCRIATGCHRTLKMCDNRVFCFMWTASSSCVARKSKLNSIVEALLCFWTDWLDGPKIYKQPESLSRHRVTYYSVLWFLFVPRTRMARKVRKEQKKLSHELLARNTCLHNYYQINGVRS